MHDAQTLTLSQRADWLAHFAKAVLRQHHLEDECYLRDVLPADGVAFDVGAHAGQYTKLFSKIASQGRVFAFEPGAYALSILTKVVRLQGLANVRVIPMALSDAVGEATYSLPIKERGSIGFGIAHLGAPDPRRPVKVSRVQTTTLDKMVEELAIERLDFIKADIEGWELHMLRGGFRTLSRFRPVLQLEVSDRFLRRAGDSSEALHALLQCLGYSGRPLDNGDFLFTPGA